MATISTVKMPYYVIPKPEQTRREQTITTRFSPTELSADVTAGDVIALADISKTAQIITAGVRVLGVVGEANCFIQAQISENSTVYVLTNPLLVSATDAGSMVMASAPPPVSTRYVKTWGLKVGGGNFDNAATSIVECTIRIDDYAEAG